MSSCDGPPTMKSTMLAFAFGVKLGNFGAAGAGAATREVLAARNCSSENMPAKPSAPMPPVRDEIQSRRERFFFIIMARK